jgi:hypothetical protein
MAAVNNLNDLRKDNRVDKRMMYRWVDIASGKL